MEGEGARLENLAAIALLKELHYLEDTTGMATNLHYARTKEGKELDFVICMDGEVTHLIEVKNGDNDPSPAFDYFLKYFSRVRALQLVNKCQREKTFPSGLEVRALLPWLAAMRL